MKYSENESMTNILCLWCSEKAYEESCGSLCPVEFYGHRILKVQDWFVCENCIFITATSALYF